MTFRHLRARAVTQTKDGERFCALVAGQSGKSVLIAGKLTQFCGRCQRITPPRRLVEPKRLKRW